MGDTKLNEFECPKALAAIAKERDAARADVERLRECLRQTAQCLGEAEKTIRMLADGAIDEDEPGYEVEARAALALLASQLGVSLGEAVMAKWNRTSKKVGAPIYIDAEDWHYAKDAEQSHDAP